MDASSTYPGSYRPIVYSERGHPYNQGDAEKDPRNGSLYRRQGRGAAGISSKKPIHATHPCQGRLEVTVGRGCF